MKISFLQKSCLYLGIKKRNLEHRDDEEHFLTVTNVKYFGKVTRQFFSWTSTIEMRFGRISTIKTRFGTGWLLIDSQGKKSWESKSFEIRAFNIYDVLKQLDSSLQLQWWMHMAPNYFFTLQHIITNESLCFKRSYWLRILFVNR